jgi:hypothetical protein
MSMDQRFIRPLGALCLLASDPMIEAGIMAARSFAEEGDAFRLAVSWVSVAAAALLLLAGLMLLFKRASGRVLAIVSTAVSVPVCVFSAAIGLMGGHALMYGVGFPIVIVLLLSRATPSSGLGGEQQPSAPAAPSSNDLHLRTSIV